MGCPASLCNKIFRGNRIREELLNLATKSKKNFNTHFIFLFTLAKGVIPAGKFGYYTCDTPTVMLDSLFQHIKDNHQDVSFYFLFFPKLDLFIKNILNIKYKFFHQCSNNSKDTVFQILFEI